MGLTIGAQADANQADTASTVNSILLTAGAPALRESNSGKSIVYSARHDGLAITLARLLRPLWYARVTAVIAGGKQVLSLSESQLLSVQGRLEQLRRYVDE